MLLTIVWTQKPKDGEGGSYSKFDKFRSSKHHICLFQYQENQKIIPTNSGTENRNPYAKVMMLSIYKGSNANSAAAICNIWVNFVKS